MRGKKKEKYLWKANNKKLVSQLLQLSRKIIYYQKIKNIKDLEDKKIIENLHFDHPAYGHRRIAIKLSWSKNKTRRIMKKFGIKPPRRKIRFKYKTPIEDKYTNLIKDIVVSRPYQIFVSDFTYLKYKNKNVYLATVQDKFTREIMAAELSFHHDSNLIMKTLQTAFKKNIPEYFHSDRGSEFISEEVTNYLKKNNIKISRSTKASPWENGHQESFYDKFKSENGDINRFEKFGEYIEEIYSYMNYYNNHRIHTALKMPPIKFRQNYFKNKNNK